MPDIKVKVLGPGCANCEKLYQATKAVVAELGADVDLEYVKDMGQIAKYVMLTPGLVVNEKVVHQGKPLPNAEKIKALIQNAGR